MALSLSDLPPKQQWIVSGVLCVALLGIYYMQFWRPNSAQAAQISNQIQTLRAEVLEMQAVAVNLPELREEMLQLDQRLAILSHILPEEYETANLLRGVGTIAAQSNLDILGLTFRDPVPYEFYAESPIELELVGSYHDLARFFDRIGKFSRIINIDEVDINSTGGGDNTVSATVTAMTFIFLDDGTDELSDDLEELLRQ
ncbi:MAG: type 4a pilus biogenesis protein PilO [Acidobacteria bacterium]|nr:type 4a pilus biogenesis protein PilO [Acidobacteriota bacterium]